MNPLVLFYTTSVSISEPSLLQNSKFQELFNRVREQARAECEARFLYDSWNCSLHSGKTSLLSSGYYRETATLTALASASFIIAVSRGCALGLITSDCSNPSMLGSRLARKFLGKETTLKKYNIQLGIEMVLSTKIRICKCHGVSGSCTMTSCWHVLGPLPTFLDLLHQRYFYGAHKQAISNEVTQKGPGQPSYSSDLIYLDNSPDFCANGESRGRRCRDMENCEAVCCARGFSVLREAEWRRCNCKFISYTHVQCQNCIQYQKMYYCK